jgi:beta-glucosidase
MIAHGYAKDSKQAAEIAIKAGSDMDMESSAYVGYLVELVQEGRKRKSSDDAARRILKVLNWGCSITHTSVTKLAKRNGRKC